jgi:hypothetical protein
MRKHCLLLLILLLAAVSLGCKSSQNPKDYSDSLVVISGAKNVNYGKVNKTDQVWFTLNVDYPADAVISALSKQLSDKGWSPLTESYLNPGIPTSFVRGWTQFEDGTKQPNEIVHTWSTDWQNKKGDILKYMLSYRYPNNAQVDMTSMSVVAIYVPADIAQALKKASLEMLNKYNKPQSSAK